MGGYGIVGGNLPIAAGLALASQYKGEDAVTVCMFGDGASNAGNFGETMNLAALWTLPVLFLVENNLYGMGTAVERHSAQTDLSKKAEGYGIPGRGSTAWTWSRCARRSPTGLRTAREEERPTLIEVVTYRYRGHSAADPEVYREREEVEEWREKDPIESFARRCVEAGVLGEREVGQARDAAEATVRRGGRVRRRLAGAGARHDVREPLRADRLSRRLVRGRRAQPGAAPRRARGRHAGAGARAGRGRRRLRRGRGGGRAAEPGARGRRPGRHRVADRPGPRRSSRASRRRRARPTRARWANHPPRATPTARGARRLMAELRMREALRDAMAEEMRRDESVFVMGEDVGVFRGAFKVTDGLLDEFGERRVRDTPISENTIVGAGVGAAMNGLRPIVELMTVNFSLLALDQIVNHAAAIPYMFNGQAKVPMVIRMPGGGGHQLGPTHSHSFEALYLQVPGLLVACPSTPADAQGPAEVGDPRRQPGRLHRAREPLRSQRRGRRRRRRAGAVRRSGGCAARAPT